jgi:hypothetical protein
VDRKGFIHVVEIIAVVLAVFVLIFQLMNTPAVNTDWSSIVAKNRANDLVYSLEASGVNWFNYDSVWSRINSTVNQSNMIYSVELRNVIKPGIRVGCVCYNSGEFAEVEGALRSPSFSINGQNPDFEVFNITDSGTGKPDMPFDYDVIIVMDYNISYTDTYKYLGNGGGVIEVRDLTREIAGGNSGDSWAVHTKLFGVNWSVDAPHPSSSAIQFTSFSGSFNTTFYNIQNYFYHIPNSSGMRINQTHSFADFLNYEDTVNVTYEYTDTQKVILYQLGTNSPALVANIGMVDGKGRAAWMPEAALNDDDMSVLLKSLSVWASGERYMLIPNVQMYNPSSSTLYKVYSADMFQPVEIILTLGNIY